MTYIPLKFVSESVAAAIENKILLEGGAPSMDRILILSPKDQEVSMGGIIIPGSAKEGIPNKGVVITQGYISDEYKPYINLVKTGKVVTYGMYAGKEVNFNPKIFEGISIDFSKYVFTVLSLTEVIFSENNPI